MRRRAGVLLAAMVLMAPDAARPGPRTSRMLDLGPTNGAAVERALAGAARRLENPECRRIFADFRDGSGEVLKNRLDALGLSGSDYLSLILFTDGFGRGSCRSAGVMAVTAPGSRVVYVCRRFWETEAHRPEHAELIVLHEALHTLGLGENPPDSMEITQRVAARCGR